MTIHCSQFVTDREACAADDVCALECFNAYMTRYLTCKTPKTCMDYAAVHFGGPGGCDTIPGWLTPHLEACCLGPHGCDE